jgi:hypothetical protein
MTGGAGLEGARDRTNIVDDALLRLDGVAVVKMLDEGSEGTVFDLNEVKSEQKLALWVGAG